MVKYQSQFLGRRDPCLPNANYTADLWLKELVHLLHVGNDCLWTSCHVSYHARHLQCSNVTLWFDYVL